MNRRSSRPFQDGHEDAKRKKEGKKEEEKENSRSWDAIKEHKIVKSLCGKAYTCGALNKWKINLLHKYVDGITKK